MLDLRTEWLEMLRELIAAHLPGVEVLAYGSRVQGTAHDGSDLDLVLRNPDGTALPLMTLEDFREVLSESDLPILVDVLDWARIPESFRKEIERGGFVVLGRGKEE
jgi:predicted nucleotidyltransferase